MTAYNEVDIVRPSIERLLAQGIEVHLLDNWSTDGTGDAVADLVAPGRLTIERHPEGGRPEGYDWTGLLHKVSEVAAASDADWCVHHDVDQRRDSPWPGVSYRDALYRVQTTGWNAVDHTIFEFRPTDDDFVDGTEVSDHLRHFELVPAARSAAHVQAWRNERVVDLSETGGHDATFEGRRVFPLNFTLRHYPIRSQRHGDRKVFRDRVPRYAADEMARGWHYHYARLRHGHRFVLDPAGLHPYDETTFSADFMLPRVGQTGIPIREAGARNAAKAVGVEVLRRTGALPRLLRVAGRDRS
jgi:glycosyltransferase involved in cell wall biosynthesis